MAAVMGILKRENPRYAYRERKNGDMINEQERGLLKDSIITDEKLYINKGECDQMEYTCYRISALRSFLTYTFIVLSGGLLRLVFHWVPHWFMKARCIRTDVASAEYLLITELYNEKHRIYHVKPVFRLTTADAIKLRNGEGVGEINPDEIRTFSVHFEGGNFENIERIVTFKCKKVTYVYKSDSQEFVKLKGLDNKVSSDCLHQNRGLTKAEQFVRRLLYDKNEIVVKESSIPELLFLEVLNPFYIFQIFSFLLWFLDNYYFYAGAILLMSVFGITMTVIQTRRNQRNLKSTVHSSDVATVLRRSSLTEENAISTSELISTDLLVPGDILEIPPNGCIMQCDALLLTGTCIVNESMLTGESVPVTKTPLPNLADVYYDSKEHARHTLFCGTQVIQTRYFGSEKVLAVVIRTGFSTAKGGLVRSILYPPPVDFRFESDSYRFVALLACVASLGFIYTVITKVSRGESPGAIVVQALDLITIVVPPALPAAMTVGRLYAQTRLKKSGVYCISPRSINVSGSVDCVCFDKTGTLTEDGLDLLCVVPVKRKTFTACVRDVEAELTDDVFLHGLVSCHSLTIIEKNITGDPLDLKMFESTHWSMEEPEISDNTKFDMLSPTVFKPPVSSPHHQITASDLVMPDEDIEFQIGKVREFPFSSSSQRMGVIIRKLGGQHFEYYCKGSPEMILNFVLESTVPEDFSEVLEQYTQEGYRVIALAHKELKLSYTKVQKVRREVIETEMTFLGFIVLENRLKEDTTPCIKKLNDAHIRVIMVTGDNILTAVSVARDCGIITPGQSVITVNADAGNNLYYTLTATKNTGNTGGVVTNGIGHQTGRNDVSLMTNSLSVQSLDTLESQLHNDSSMMTSVTAATRPKSIYNNYRFAMTGKVWAILKDYHPNLIPRLVTRGSIFARMAPDQKQQLVEELQTLGYYVAMCGDGANDCGALKAAHTGISLSDAESSVASPFTSTRPTIACVLRVIQEGRAALTTSFGIFKYMAAYSLCQFVSVLLLYSIESNLTDIEFLYIDLFIISIFAWFFGRTEAYRGALVKETPLNSLISLSPVLSLVLQMALVIVFQVLAFEHVQTQPWFTPFNATSKHDKDEVACVENYTVFTISSFQYVILAIVFSKGAPYRESIFTNYGFILSAILLTSFSVYLTLSPATFLVTTFELVMPSEVTFSLYLLLYAAIHCACAVAVEVLFIDNVVFKRLRFKFHNVAKSKRQFLRIERDLEGDGGWPVLCSGFKGGVVVSPVAGGGGGGGLHTEIVVEKENTFGKNHVLNSLYSKGGGRKRKSLEGMRIGSDETLSIQDVTTDSGDFYQSADTLDNFPSSRELPSDDNDLTSKTTTPTIANSTTLGNSDASFQTARTAHSLPNTPRISAVVVAVKSSPPSNSNNLVGGGYYTDGGGTVAATAAASLPNSPRMPATATVTSNGASVVVLNGCADDVVMTRRAFSDFSRRSVDRGDDSCCKSYEMSSLDVDGAVGR